MQATVKTGLAAPTSTLPGPIKLKTKAGDVYKKAMAEPLPARRGIRIVSAAALAGSEENARGHLVITAPTGGSAGVMPAVIYSLGPDGANKPQQKLREALLAGAIIGYLCKHNATLSAAEGGCQAEIGVASGMGGAAIAAAHDDPPFGQRSRSSAGAPSRHDLRPGRRVRPDPMHRALRVRRGEVLDRLSHRQERDLGEPARRYRRGHHSLGPDRQGHEPKYKETSEAGLAQSLVLC